MAQNGREGIAIGTETRSEDPLSTLVDEDDETELFAAVLATLDKDRLPTLASAVRQRIDPRLDEDYPTVERPIFGSYHVLFPLAFQDGTRWLAKFPVNGTPDKWDALSSRALFAEANTMRLLKRETTIPLPDVFDFSETSENQLRCPYILISFIPGKPLYDIWFGHRLGNLSVETVQDRRTRALHGIAAAMGQLGKFSFQRGGFITFNSDGNPSGIGPMRFLDNKAMLDRWFIHQDPADDPIYVEANVFDNPGDYYTFTLDLHESEKPFSRGLASLLRQLIHWLPAPTNIEPFVLAHPDFDIQNFLVSEEGELQGIIDWDGIAVVPRSIGSEMYPGWLTRDWDPAMYAYTESMEDGIEPEGVWEDSPATLRYYRSVYRDMISGYNSSGSADTGPDLKLPQMSLIAENLAIAAQDPSCREEIIRKIVSSIAAGISNGEVDLDFMGLVDRFANGSAGDLVVETLRDGFIHLLSKADL